jgi:CheY-like chemotaxis protein
VLLEPPAGALTLSPIADPANDCAYTPSMNKRALIVDDSRSARVILSRMLEGYGLEVDSSESAEQALEYLKQGRPDVIFMDHLMPGMDGFQAIQAIKGNPGTAMIPVVMYTSQEGELYVSQARALGAVGVLPKTVKQVDVSRVLYQLRLLPERREGRTTAPAHETAAVRIDSPGASVGEIEGALRNVTAPLLKEHGLEMRRLILASLEAFARRITNEARPAAAPPAPQPQPVAVEPERPRSTLHWPLAAAIAAVALLPTVVLAILHVRTLEATKALMQSNAHLAAVVEEQQSQLSALQQAARAQPPQLASTEPVAQASTETEPVPYGEAPLAGARLDRLRELLAELKAEGFRGTVKIATYIGEFCLTGNGIEGYSIAADDMPLKRCDLFGNPFEDGLTPAQRQSLAFANLLSSVRQDAAAGVNVEVQYEGRQPSVPYPAGDQLARLTAGDWNRIAAQNNRVEFAAQPAGS